MIMKISIKKCFKKFVKEKLDEIKDLTYDINSDYLTNYFKGNTIKKGFDDFSNSIELFYKIQSVEMKLKKAKNCRIYLNQI